MENAGRAVADAASAASAGPAASWSWPGRATTAATGSWRRACWPSAAIGCGCSCSASAAGSRAMPRGGQRAGPGRSNRRRRQALAGCDVIIDALFGAGLDRPVEGLPRAMIEAMNAGGAPVIAVDLPSGINGTTGAVMGAAVKADANGDLLPPQARPLLLPGRLHCGESRWPTSAFRRACWIASSPRTFANEPALWRGAVSAARSRRAQIRPRPCGRGVGRPLTHRCGAARGARGAARRRRAGDHRHAARGAGGQCRRQPGRHGAAGGWRG